MPPKSNAAPAFKTQAKPAAPAAPADPAALTPPASPPEPVEAPTAPEEAVQEPEAPEAPPAPPEAPKPPVTEARLVPHGCMFVRHPELIGCTFEGISLSPDEEGCILVPNRALEVLAGHGFEQVR